MRNCSATRAAAHMQLCEARCSKCFYSDIISLGQPCRCYDARKFPAASGGLALQRYVCRDCNKLTDKEILVLREKRDKGDMYANTTQRPLACAKCAEALPLTGPLWWACSKCSVECRSHDHPGWGKKLEV